MTMPTLRILPLLVLGAFLAEAQAETLPSFDAHPPVEACDTVLPADTSLGLAEDWPLYDGVRCLDEPARMRTAAVAEEAIAAPEGLLAADGSFIHPAGEGADAGTVAESQPAPAPTPNFDVLATVDESTLDSLRGGFEAPGGLRMSFGIERAVFINGVLHSTTHLKLEDLGQVVATLPPGATLAVIQNGPGNSVATTLPANVLGTVIQNSLNDQTLQVVNKIDIKVNSAEMLRGALMQQSLQDALNRSTLTR
jgi:hypothetical protein